MLLCDVWGVVHNGVARFPRACDALMRARARGGAVVLITNAPRPSEVVARQLEHCTCRARAYDAIVSLGRRHPRGDGRARAGQSLFHLGPERDRSIFDGLDVRFAPLERADYVVCSGLERRRGRDAGGLPRAARGDARRASCSWSAAIPTSWSSAATRLVYCAGAHRRPLRTPWAARCSMPASRTGRSTIWRSRRRAALPAARPPLEARAGDRRFGAHRS